MNFEWTGGQRSDHLCSSGAGSAAQFVLLPRERVSNILRKIPRDPYFLTKPLIDESYDGNRGEDRRRETLLDCLLTFSLMSTNTHVDTVAVIEVDKNY